MKCPILQRYWMIDEWLSVLDYFSFSNVRFIDFLFENDLVNILFELELYIIGHWPYHYNTNLIHSNLASECDNKSVLDLSKQCLKKVPKQDDAQNVKVLILDENELQKIDNIDSYLRIEKVIFLIHKQIFY